MSVPKVFVENNQLACQSQLLNKQVKKQKSTFSSLLLDY